MYNTLILVYLDQNNTFFFPKKLTYPFSFNPSVLLLSCTFYFKFSLTLFHSILHQFYKAAPNTGWQHYFLLMQFTLVICPFFPSGYWLNTWCSTSFTIKICLALPLGFFKKKIRWIWVWWHSFLLTLRCWKMSNINVKQRSFCIWLVGLCKFDGVGQDREGLFGVGLGGGGEGAGMGMNHLPMWSPPTCPHPNSVTCVPH